MPGLKITAPPALGPVSLDSMKNYLKVPNTTADDELISELIIAATEQIEGLTARSLINQKYVQSLDSFFYLRDTGISPLALPPAYYSAFPSGYYSLPAPVTLFDYSQLILLQRSPLVAVEKIHITKPDGAETDLFPALSAWEADTEYVEGRRIKDSNGNIQEVTDVDLESDNEDGTFSSGPTEPIWANQADQTTEDGSLTWTCRGAAPTTPDFLYDVNTEPPRLFPVQGQVWPGVLGIPNVIKIYFTAGYGEVQSAVPAALKVAVRQLVADWYFNREPVVAGGVAELPNHIQSLVMNWRVDDFTPQRG